MTDILDIVEGEEFFNPEDLDEREVLGDDEDEHNKLIKKEEAEGDDLYDAAIEPSGINDKRESTDSASLASVKKEINVVSYTQSQNSVGSAGKRYCCYVGNMTWWTTDNDLQNVIVSCNVNATELVDLKFHENRNNGQSKGFALAVFSTEAAVRAVSEKLPHKKLHDQSLVVLPYNKQSLAKLEEATKRIEPKEKKDEKQGMVNIGTIRIGSVSTAPSINIGMPISTGIRPNVPPPAMGTQQPTSLMNIAFPNQQQSLPSNGPSQFHVRPGATGTTNLNTLPPPLIQQQQRPSVNLSGPPPSTNVPPPSVNVLNRPPPNFSQQQQSMHGVINTSAPPPQQNNAIIYNQIPGVGVRTSIPPPGIPGGVPGSTHPGLPPGAHINPQVYPSFAQGYGGQGAVNNVSHPENGGGGGNVSEAEFEEIMNRNRTVSSSAINRAVSDATAGDYGSAIETLVTAISLIRQSRVANDDRCKVLIAALQDTLQGIESKSYNLTSRKHRSGRERSRSPSDRAQRKRHRRSSRSRSRSRDRYDYSPRHSTRRY